MGDKCTQHTNLYIWLRDPVGTIYIRVREPVGTMGSAECAPKPWCLAAPPRLLRETQPPAPEHVVLCGNVRGCVVLCGNVRLVPAEQSRVAHWLLLGAAGQRSNPSVCCRLPGAVFHLSTPVRPSALVKPKPSSEFTNVTIVESSIPSASCKV